MMQTSKEKGKNSIEGNEVNTPVTFLGMEFDSEDQAHAFCNEYIAKVGFGVRKEWININKEGEVMNRIFFFLVQKKALE